jgi:hypothetical protein
MTIALGILASNGCVIAADTEETADLKRLQNKVITGQDVDLTVKPPVTTIGLAVSGAGYSAYLDCAIPEMIKEMLDRKTQPIEAIKDAVGARLRRFYLDHVVPFSRYPSDERPDFELIFGVVRDGGKERRLWITNKTTITSTAPHDAVGAGQTYAKILLQKLRDVNVDVSAAELMAIYVASQVKEMIRYCGKETVIVSISDDNSPQYLDQEKIKELEDIFHRQGALEREVLHYAIGMQPDSHSGQIARWMRALRKDVMKIYRG